VLVESQHGGMQVAEMDLPDEELDEQNDDPDDEE
jgi:hypothetical protein